MRLLPIAMMEPAPVSLAKRIVSVLSPVLGKHTATKAGELVCKRLEKDADALIDADLQPACEILLPVLRQLVGGAVAQQVLIRLQTSYASDMETK